MGIFASAGYFLLFVDINLIFHFMEIDLGMSREDVDNVCR